MAIESNRVIGDTGLTATPDGVRLDIRLPWYRSLPLSTVEIGDVQVDGQSVPLDGIMFELEGHTYSLKDLESQTGHVWFVLDSAFLHLPGVSPTGEYEVSILLFLYPPYIRGLKRPTFERRRLTVTQKEKVDG